MASPKRIYRDRWYLVERTPGLSGFQRWGRIERWIERPTSNNRLDIVSEYVFTGQQVRVNNGRCPEYQPVCTDIEAARDYAGYCFYIGEIDRGCA